MAGSSTSRRTRLAEATSNWPLASWISLAPVLQLGQGAAMVGLQALSEAGVSAGDLRESLGVRRGLAGDGQPPAGGLEIEVGLGDPQQRVVGRGLEPGLVRGQDAPRRHGLEDRVGDPQRRAQAVQRRESRSPATARGTSWPAPPSPPRNSELRSIVCDLAGDRLDLAVGPIPGRPVEERRQPQRRACFRSAAAWRICCRAMAISRSRPPASFSALARSIGSTDRPGISVVSTGKRGGGGGVVLGRSGLSG